MLKVLIQQIGKDLAAVVAIAVAVGVALVAAAFALYAGLATTLVPAAASGLTAVVFALIAVGAAVVAPRLGRRRAAAPAPRAPLNPVVIQSGIEIGMLALGVASEMLLRRRARNDKTAATSRRR